MLAAVVGRVVGAPSGGEGYHPWSRFPNCCFSEAWRRPIIKSTLSTRTFVADRSTLLTGAALKAVGFAGHLYEPKTRLACIIGQYLMAQGMA